MGGKEEEKEEAVVRMAMMMMMAPAFTAIVLYIISVALSFRCCTRCMHSGGGRQRASKIETETHRKGGQKETEGD